MNIGYLVAAVLFEVAGTMSLKYTQGMTKLLPTLCMFVFYTLSVSCLSVAVKKMYVGTGYAIWTSSGTALVTILGVWWFKEDVSWVKVLSILLIILGVVGLHLNNVK